MVVTRGTQTGPIVPEGGGSLANVGKGSQECTLQVLEFNRGVRAKGKREGEGLGRHGALKAL